MPPPGPHRGRGQDASFGPGVNPPPMCNEHQIPGSSKPTANVEKWVKRAPAFQVVLGIEDTEVVPLPGPGCSLGENEGRASIPGPKEGQPRFLHFVPQTLFSSRFPGPSPGAEVGKPPQEEMELKGQAGTCPGSWLGEMGGGGHALLANGLPRPQRTAPSSSTPFTPISVQPPPVIPPLPEPPHPHSPEPLAPSSYLYGCSPPRAPGHHRF